MLRGIPTFTTGGVELKDSKILCNFIITPRGVPTFIVGGVEELKDSKIPCNFIRFQSKNKNK